jgi:hypothetical protein
MNQVEYFEIRDGHGNALAAVEQHEGHMNVVIDGFVRDATGFPETLTVYSKRALEELQALLVTMLEDTGH